MTLPDFFVIGACRAGTSALFAVLYRHPQVFMPYVKEPHFFLTSEERIETLDREMRHDLSRWKFTPSVPDPFQYMRLFCRAQTYQVAGESSTGYLASSSAAQRIHASLPQAKIVAILREPVERAHAHYWFKVLWDFDRSPTFEELLAAEAASGRQLPLDCFNHGRYHAHLSRYYDLFPEDQLRVYLYEEWRDSPQEMLLDLCGFLGIDAELLLPVQTKNVTYAPRSRWLRRCVLSRRFPGLEQLDRRYNLVRPPPIREETRQQLLGRYRPDIEQLQALIGRDLSHWLDPNRVAMPNATA
jgi:Sulfotransferase family